MEGRFVVAFVALSIIAELKNQLGRARTFRDKRKKKIAPPEYSVADLIDMTAWITIQSCCKNRQKLGFRKAERCIEDFCCMWI